MSPFFRKLNDAICSASRPGQFTPKKIDVGFYRIGVD
jgi:hypothetical protein